MRNPKPGYNKPGVAALLLSVLLFHIGCTSKTMKEQDVNSKFDAHLRMKLGEMEHARQDTSLPCLLQCDGVVDEQKKQQLETAGLRVMTVVDEIATVEGSPDAIRRAAKYDFVRSISLSRTRPPLQKQ